MVICICNNVRTGETDRYHLIGTNCGKCKMTGINNSEVERFLRNLLDPEMYGHAVTGEVRDEARKLLGMAPVETSNPNWEINEGV